MKKVKSKKKQNKFVKSYWNGEESLAFSFWVISIIGLTIISIPNVIVMMQGDNYFDSMSSGAAFIYLIYVLGVFSVTIFAYIGLWRCAGKYILQKKKTKRSAIWGYLTYIYIVLGVIQSASRMVTG